MVSNYLKKFASNLVLIVPLIFFAFLFSCFHPTVSSTSPGEEAAALLKWKDSLHNQNHSSLPSWILPTSQGRDQVNSSFHCNNWVGIYCNDAGNIVEITLSNTNIIGTLHSFPSVFLSYLVTLDLSYNALLGVISVHIANISQLEYLNLSNNLFSGRLPSAISQLARLQALYLNNNNLDGAIPSELTKMRSLEALDVSENSLCCSIPPYLGNMTKLKHLYIHTNLFSGPIPSEIGNLKSILTLDLSANNLNGSIPSSLFSLVNLTNLLLSKCQLSGSIPREIGNLTSLARIELFNNSFSGSIPSSTTNLTRLVTLYLHNNRLSGSIPVNIGNLISLDQLGFDSNKLTGPVPSSLGNMRNLSVLNLSNNQLSGLIPPNLGNMTKLKHLYIYTNLFSGPIPSEIGNLESIVTLDLSANNLNGSIPSSLFSLVNLTNLLLSKCQLSGAIPREIGNLTSLARIEFSNNSFSGCIPSSITNLTRLVTLYLHNNKLSGSLPIELGNLTSLSSLSLMSNQLSGPVPQGISKSNKLVFLTLSYNNFSGELPQLCTSGLLETFTANDNKFTGLKSMKNCSFLTRVRLDRNLITGNISEAFGTHPKLYFMDLSYNNFFGELSSNWSKCTSLTNFKVSSNNITGRIPRGFGGLTQLGNLDISLNHFKGQIPKDLGRLASLVSLNMSQNHLSGYLPTEIGNLSSLAILDLSSNDLSGPIPKEMGDCSHLLCLDLSGNSLNGSIPFQLGNLLYLQMLLDLGQNMFTGEIPSDLSKLRQLEKLNMSHNMLSGSIPSSFDQMISLMFVDVSYNDALEGPLPDSKAFRNASAQAFRGNLGLCGQIHVLQPCQLSSARKGGGVGSKIFKIIISCLAGMLCFIFSFIGIYFMLYKKKKDTNETREDVKKDLFNIWYYDGKVVYEDIIQATEGFDDKHCIGIGGYGSVYRATLSTGQIVAVKKFHPLQDGEVVNLGSFTTEIRALSELKHRNIVKLYGYCSHAQHSFLVYEYLERGSLAELLSNVEEAVNLDWIKRIDIIHSVANALCYMHHGCKLPLVHRDISSKNILLNSEYDAYVADFGIARILQPNSSNWTTPIGTPGYLAPEFAYSMRLTEKSDAYSFGVLTLEVIMGSHPGEFISSLGTLSSQGGDDIAVSIMDNLDKRLKHPMTEIYKEITVLSNLAFACLNHIPESRPTFEFISKEISTCKLSLTKTSPIHKEGWRILPFVGDSTW